MPLFPPSGRIPPVQNNATISNNITPSLGSSGGGGIRIEDGSATITDSTVSGNTGINGGGLNADGDSTIRITNTMISGNSGGGVQGLGTLEITGSTISGNTGSGVTTGASTSMATIDSTTIQGNSTKGSGGGISMNAGGTLIVRNGSMITDNTATFDGGGIRSDLNGTLTVDNVTVSGNTAGRNGGGVFSFSGNSAIIRNSSTISLNQAGADGGGIYKASGTLRFDDSTLINNTAERTGGGIDNAGVLTLAGTSTLLGINDPDTVSGSGIVSVNAPGGTVTFAADTLSTYTGSTSLVSGTLVVDGKIDNNGMLDGSAGDVFVRASATLSGGGILDAPVTVQNIGKLSPGGDDTAILTTGDIDFDDAMGNPIFEVQVNGVTTSGVDYDQLRVIGSVHIDPGTVLSISGTVTGTKDGDVVTLIDNDGSDEVTGQFQGLMDGDTVTINGEEFQINYNGGDGNNVVLASSQPTTSPPLTVYVNDDFAALTPGTVIDDADPNTAGDQAAIFGVTAFATIQEGIDAVDAGGTVFITDDFNGVTGPADDPSEDATSPNAVFVDDGPGIYLENLIITKDVTLIGTEADSRSVVVDGNQVRTTVIIDATVAATIDSVTIQNGSSSVEVPQLLWARG